MKKILIFLFLFVLTQSFGQSGEFNTGTLHLRNGDSISGTVKLVWHSNNIIFKKEGSNKRKTYTYKEVKYVQMTGYETNSYIYKIVDGGGGVPKLLQEVIIDPELSLFMDTTQKYVPKTHTGSVLKLGNVKFIEERTSVKPTLVPIWFSGKRESDYVAPLPSVREEIMQKFNDCQAVVLKYRNVENKDFYIPEFVRFYNENCK